MEADEGQVPRGHGDRCTGGWGGGGQGVKSIWAAGERKGVGGLGVRGYRGLLGQVQRGCVCHKCCVMYAYAGWYCRVYVLVHLFRAGGGGGRVSRLARKKWRRCIGIAQRRYTEHGGRYTTGDDNWATCRQRAYCCSDWADAYTGVKGATGVGPNRSLGEEERCSPKGLLAGSHSRPQRQVEEGAWVPQHADLKIIPPTTLISSRDVFRTLCLPPIVKPQYIPSALPLPDSITGTLSPNHPVQIFVVARGPLRSNSPARTSGRCG